MASMTGGTERDPGPSNAKMAALCRAVGSAALDLGCGRGWYASALADGGFRVIGMDRVDQVTDARIEMHVGDIRPPLPFLDESFDTVLMFDILEHLEAEAEILSEVRRGCRAGGRIILSVPIAE